MIPLKAEMVEVVREAVLMGETRLMSLPFICAALTRLRRFLDRQDSVYHIMQQTWTPLLIII